MPWESHTFHPTGILGLSMGETSGEGVAKV